MKKKIYKKPITTFENVNLSQTLLANSWAVDGDPSIHIHDGDPDEGTPLGAKDNSFSDDGEGGFGSIWDE